MGWLSGTTIAMILFAIGTTALIVRKDLVIKLLALGLVNSSSILFLISIRFRPEMEAPILPAKAGMPIADPLPQALVLSAIVINFAILALSLVFVMLLVERYHSTDCGRIEHAVETEKATLGSQSLAADPPGTDAQEVPR
jgi:multicomponent Na+:H+ antiporter subunit C